MFCSLANGGCGRLLATGGHMRRLAMVLGASLILTVSGLWVMEAQEKQKQNPNFTGGTVTPLEENSKGAIAHFRFDPGARTKWHSHEGGQIILVEEGVGRTQVKGG